MSLYAGYWALGGLDPSGRFVLGWGKLLNALGEMCKDCSEVPCGFFSCLKSACIEEAFRIAKAIGHTISKVKQKRAFVKWGRSLVRGMYGWIPGCENWGRDDTAKGYYCYEWALGYKKAIDFESSGICFSAEVQFSLHDSSYGELHSWLKVTSTCSNRKVFLDDGFMSNFPGYCHDSEPKSGCYDTPTIPGSPAEPFQPVDGGPHVCDPIPAYDHRGVCLTPEPKTDPPRRRYPDGTSLDEHGTLRWGPGPKW